MGLSRRAYAQYRKERGLPGGSESAVRKAIAAGRITLEANGLIDPGRADQDWDAVTDSARQRSAGPERPEAVPAAPPAEPEATADTGTGAITFQKARTAEMAIRVQRAKLALQRERGELVNRTQANAHVFTLARQERDHWLQLPARSAAMMASELGVDAHRMEKLLDDVIRLHLAELAELKIDVGSSGL